MVGCLGWKDELVHRMQANIASLAVIFFLLLIPCAQNQIALPLHSTLIYQGTFVDGHYSAGVPPAADKDHHDHQSQRLIRL